MDPLSTISNDVTFVTCPFDLLSLNLYGNISVRVGLFGSIVLNTQFDNSFYVICWQVESAPIDEHGPTRFLTTLLIFGFVFIYWLMLSKAYFFPAMDKYRMFPAGLHFYFFGAEKNGPKNRVVSCREQMLLSQDFVNGPLAASGLFVVCVPVEYRVQDK